MQHPTLLMGRMRLHPIFGGWRGRDIQYGLIAEPSHLGIQSIHAARWHVAAHPYMFCPHELAQRLAVWLQTRTDIRIRIPRYNAPSMFAAPQKPELRLPCDLFPRCLHRGTRRRPVDLSKVFASTCSEVLAVVGGLTRRGKSTSAHRKAATAAFP